MAIKYKTLEPYFQNKDILPINPKIAEQIKSLVLKMVDSKFYTDELLESAIQSLGFLTETDIATMYNSQNDFCIKCGNCCRVCNPIVFAKDELKRLADYQRIPYKKLKQKYKISPRRGEKGLFNLSARPCPFLNENLCTIYEVRPNVCQNYPTGYSIAQIVEGKSLLFPKCSAIEHLLAIIAATRILREIIFQTKPELYDKINDYSESIYKEAYDKPELERIYHIIEANKKIFNEFKLK